MAQPINIPGPIQRRQLIMKEEQQWWLRAVQPQASTGIRLQPIR
eukprot:CAMPEP_0206498956 /NCGR_PEP_ID=MMETSP0324_2-20121206/51377_1 /ASSEMBLY_ACC=CAM_ASM_000836 /TAXON_ID=2866 /ORGANISM="Crypthecodinium cohnii, Strain Seligo" /LENGTH=43 /DNA_ID= /DNA_START= /DNA_END= /DNA_ORIENTATION=